VKYFIILLLSLIIYSCEYRNDLFYESEVKERVMPTIEVLDLGLDVDSFFIFERLDFKYNFDAGSNEIYRVSAYVDDVLYSYHDSHSGTFTFKVWDFEEGYHKLNIKIITDTYSNNIADKLQADGFIFSSHDYIFYCMEVPDNIKLDCERIIDNKNNLLFKWKAFHFPGIEYVVEKRLGHSKNPIVNTFISSKPQINDQEFAGEKAHYTIWVKKGEKLKPSHWGYFVTKKEMPTIQIIPSKPSFLLKWEIPEYKMNLEGIRIYNNESGQDLGIFSTDVNEIILEEYPFGSIINYSLFTIPKRIPEYYENNLSYFSANIIGKYGYPVRGGHCLLSRSSSPLLFYTENGNVYSYNLDQEKVLDSLFVDPYYEIHEDRLMKNYLFLSTSEKHFAVFSNYHNKVYWGDINDLSFYSSWDYSFSGGLNNILVGEHELILVTNSHLHFFNKQNKTIFKSISIIDLGLREGKIPVSWNSTGGYITFKQNDQFYCFRQEGDELIFNYSVPYEIGEDLIRINSNNQNTLFHFKENTIYVRNLSDFSPISNHSILAESKGNILDIDFYSGNYLYTQNYRDLFVNDIFTGEHKFTIQSKFNSSTNFKIAENIVWNSEGFKLYFD
jgi:hypothetical protein